MNPLSWPAETWLWVCEWGGLVAAGVSVMLLFGALRAGKVVRDRQDVEMQALKLNVAKQQERAEQETIKRLELEKSVVSRVVPIFMNAQRENNFDPLRLFVGTKVKVEYINEPEPRRLANMVVGVLRRAGWDASYAPIAGDPLSDGVEVRSERNWASAEYKAAKALTAFLRINDVEAIHLANDESLPGHKHAPKQLTVTISLPSYLVKNPLLGRSEEWKAMDRKRAARDKEEAEKEWNGLWDSWREKAKNATPTNSP